MPPSPGARVSFTTRRGGNRALRALLAALITVGVLGGLGIGLKSYLERRGLAWQARRGLELLTAAHTPVDTRAALARWEEETRAAWEPRRSEFIEHLYSGYPLGDPRVRLLLTQVSGADYGDRQADWQRWHEARTRLRAGQPPRVPAGQAVRLELRWQAPVGLTAWFSTILALDGQIYVSSLGADYAAAEDDSDGVVRVDGSTGASTLLWSPTARPGRGPRDVIGIAAGRRVLLAACLNGTVAAVTPDSGAARWEVHVGSPIVSPPLTVDLNDDGQSDAVVLTQNGKVVALSGETGRTSWVVQLAQPPAGADLLGAGLALGDVLPGQGAEIVATTPLGHVQVLARTGRTRWQHKLAAGTLTGPVCADGTPSSLYIADRAANVWSGELGGTAPRAALWGTLAVRSDETLIAALRTLPSEDERGPALLVCPTGDFHAGRGGVCALGSDGVRWRVPVDGAVWGAPAVADLNGDRRAEIVVTSIEGPAAGALTVLSDTGHVLARVALGAPVECAPVVADVDGDGYLEVLVADQAGLLHCFGTRRFGPVYWGAVGGDSHNTRNAAHAFAFGQRPAGYQWEWLPE